MKRSPDATAEQILQWFYENPEGVTGHHAYKILPGHRLSPGILGELVDQGKLTVAMALEPPGPQPISTLGWADPWGFRYRLAYDEWVIRASRDKLGDG